MHQVFVNIVAEDRLSEAVIRRLLHESPLQLSVGRVFSGHGRGYISSRINGFIRAAQYVPFVIVMDSDVDACAQRVLLRLNLIERPPNCIIRIAVHEVESWLLADTKGIASFLGIPSRLIPAQTDHILHPKEFIIEKVRKYGKRSLRTEIVPADGSTATQGPMYNDILSQFVLKRWNIHDACNKSESLLRAVRNIKRFRPECNPEA